jgi:hypothetical protein
LIFVFSFYFCHKMKFQLSVLFVSMVMLNVSLKRNRIISYECRCGRDRRVVEFTFIYEIRDYGH